ncbi:MAG TPA: membrane dipeptidase [Polyangiaceae bacterium LLY-WYZ-15_(1-7)]|nr:membrane dipeptidase [Polyangiaceae bacterium LLY-WYZ-15_(1-7)]HJL03837.1 membrane dipeptidase [Polyangiaceae bacterium LLY-WYZ-15_(1-7)]HJL07573.1 membrane dipeptidase [Polyangiaceae bacterium LLY-WYZ-15_(1-7)]HJL30912.1 membrane dipeptidase [Polyangiaceae bacterium LLY-WYZ-15_(1-7)]HJL38380.1 membrane dipeptidase [Polyangiaceae bacterium LLY-WYZ-15_(1-7)]
MRLAHRDWSAEPEAWARALDVSREAIELYASSDVIDLHLDSFIWTRIFGYDLRRKHGLGLFGRHFYSQVDFPRALEAGLTGGTWIITTNPFKPARWRRDAFFRNLDRIKALFAETASDFQHVRTAAEYRAARAAGRHGAFLGIQGGNALDHDLDDVGRIPDGDILRCTVVHLTTSSLGQTSNPLPRRLSGKEGLTDRGRDFVRRLNDAKIFVDLAHISRKAFFEAAEVHDASQPLMVTHTGVAGVYEHWRNLTDEQLRVVADTGGTIGVMFQESFLAKKGATADTIVDHLAHICDTVGEDHASIGSDYDGAISPPPDVPTLFELPKLVQLMLDRGWSDARVRKILGGNFLRVVEQLRG